MKKQIKIVGVSLIKNEDLFIEKIIQNVYDFCDELIILDNMSTDNTYEIVKNITNSHPKIKFFQIEDYKKSHSYIEAYANTDTWIFRVDGDELYDPIGLHKLRGEILNGDFREYWRIEGNSLNCTEIDEKSLTSKGYLSPPAKPAPQMYNFSLLEAWHEDYAERLHGKNPVFKENSSQKKRALLFEKFDWDNSDFRCLHLCFLKRSSSDQGNIRLNPNELSFNLLSKPINFFRNLINGRISSESNYKLNKYRKGSLVSKNIKNFF